ncbi:indigoidine synthase A-like protein [Phlegmacium glaucopus]|nr:indigoidine synthase A-like protein [Phlegmacium glaucopus]
MPLICAFKNSARPFIRSLCSWTAFHGIRNKHVPLDVHPEVEEALANRRAVVALETALVTHGLPYPSSLEVPLALEGIVRSTGSIPATIGIIDGRIKIGLKQDELARLAERRCKPAKVSRRDIAAAIATRSDGGTTCSATLVFAALAALDISADLQELTRCPVALVSSGVKSILDIGRTLEHLESLGVPVLTYGESREFPAFFSRHSGFYANAQWQLGMQNGALIAVPIPEEYEAVGEKIQLLVNQAVSESEQNGISKSGKDATPWLLKRIAELSNGESLASNIALLKNTALIGGQIAVNYQKLVNEPLHESADQPSSCVPNVTSHFSNPARNDVDCQSSANVVVIGSAAIDITAQPSYGDLAAHSTAPGHVKLTLGGVGRNIAEASHRVMAAKYPELSSILIAPIGRDPFGHLLVNELQAYEMRTDGLSRKDDRTAVCNMVLDTNGALVGGVADMGITETFTGDQIIPLLQNHTPEIVALDGNLHSDTVDTLVSYCNRLAIKAASILPAIVTALQTRPPGTAPITFCTPNLLELNQIYDAAQSESFNLMGHPAWWSTVDSLNLGTSFRMDLEQLSRRPVSDHDPSKGNMAFLVAEGIVQKAVNLLPFFQHLIVKCGDRGVVVAMRISPNDALASVWAHKRSNPLERYIVAHGNSKEVTFVQHFPSLPIETISNVTGAGDSFVGALLACLAHDSTAMYDPKSLQNVVAIAQRAAILTLQSHSAVSPLLSRIDEP